MVSGARCLFCGSSFDVGRWILKGTRLPVCDRCSTTRRQYLAPAHENEHTLGVSNKAK